jgi:hypothetical protein
MFRLTYVKDEKFPGVYYAELVLRDGGVTEKRCVVAGIVKAERGWDVTMIGGPGASFDSETFSRPTMQEARWELSARLFIGLVGQRSEGPVREVRI